MDAIKQEIWQEYVPYFLEAQELLTKTDWFADGWLYVAWQNDAFGTASGQLFRQSWRNENRNGVHFDSWIGQKELETKVVRLALHAHKDYPHSKKLIPLIAEQAKEVVKDWKGCKLSANSPMQPLTLELRLDKENLAQQLVEVYAKVSQLGTMIDKNIAELNAQ